VVSWFADAFRSDGPLSASRVHGFVADADLGCLDALCRERYTVPSGGAVDVVALAPRVVLTWTLDEDGGGRSAAAWIPVAVADRRDGGRIVARRYAGVMAHSWCGGVAVSLDPSGPRTWRAGGDEPSLTISERGRPATGAGRWHANVMDLGREVVDRFADHGGKRRVVPGLELAGDLAADLLAQRFRHVVAEAGETRVVEEPVEIRALRARSRPADLELVIHDHALRRTLGLEDQRLTLGYELEFELVLGAVDPLWSAVAA